MGEARFRSRGSCGVFAPAEVLSPVERAEERLDVPRVPASNPFGIRRKTAAYDQLVISRVMTSAAL